MDDEFHVARLCATGETLHGGDFNAALELLFLNIAELVSRKKKITLLFHTESIVLQDFCAVNDVL